MKKLTVKTELLQRMIGKISKGVINNQLLPITSLIGISLDSGLLSITACNQIDYIIR